MNIAFVVWMILYPLATAWGKLLVARRRKIENQEPFSDSVYGFTALIELGIWIFVGVQLFEG